MAMRLVRYLAHCGAASRRGAAELVQQGLVQVNGKTCANVAFQVGPDDRVSLRGKPARVPPASTVVLLHKPAGVVCSLHDPHNPETVLACLPPALRSRVKPVGRLDKQTTGLLLLTDDGDLINRLTHPRYGVEKTYRVTVTGQVSDAALQGLRQGVELDDGPASPARIRKLSHEAKGDQTILELTIHEGRKRQVRRMCEAVGHPVVRLERVRYGPLFLGGLKPGAHRRLTPAEVKELRRAAGLS